MTALSVAPTIPNKKPKTTCGLGSTREKSMAKKLRRVGGKATSGSRRSKASSSKKSKKAKPKKEPKEKLTKRQAKRKRAEKDDKKGPPTSVEAWVERINKGQKFKGSVQVGMASDLSTPYYLRRSTGILGLDIEMGGGWHAGGVAQVYGGESVGKTYLVFQTAGEVQRHYGDDAAILVVSTEIRPDKSFARKAGFRVAYSEKEVQHYEEIRAARGQDRFTEEEIHDLMYQPGKVVVVTGETGEKSLDVAYEALSAGLFQLVIIESLGALLSSDQQHGDVGDRTYGGSSVMLTNFMNKVYPLFIMDRPDGSMLETSVIGINQARAIIGGNPKGPKERAAAGAYAWKHAQLISLELNKSSSIKGEEKGPTIGREVRWVIAKGKVGTHDGKSGKYDFYHVPTTDPVFWADVELNGSTWGIDRISEMVTTSSRLGVIDRNGAWYTWTHEGKVLAKAQGAEKMADILVNDEELQLLLREECLIKAGLQVKYR
jgi:recombination protein RecA